MLLHRLCRLHNSWPLNSRRCRWLWSGHWARQWHSCHWLRLRRCCRPLLRLWLNSLCWLLLLLGLHSPCRFGHGWHRSHW